MDTIGFQFVTMKKLDDGGKFPMMVRMTIPLWEKAGKRLSATDHQREQRRRQVWRALYWYLKSQLEAVAFGLRSFEDVFMADLVTNDGRTIGDQVRERLASGTLVLPERIEP